ncbi:MAG: hypothetical protein ABIH23_12215 [bacterium]
MSTTGVGPFQKVVPLEDTRPISRRAHTAPIVSFEEDLVAAEQRVSGEIVPFPNRLPAPHPAEICPIWQDAFHDPEECELEIFFDQIENRICALEHDILTLTRQVSALLSCL